MCQQTALLFDISRLDQIAVVSLLLLPHPRIPRLAISTMFCKTHGGCPPQLLRAHAEEELKADPWSNWKLVSKIDFLERWGSIYSQEDLDACWRDLKEQQRYDPWLTSSNSGRRSIQLQICKTAGRVCGSSSRSRRGLTPTFWSGACARRRCQS